MSASRASAQSAPADSDAAAGLARTRGIDVRRVSVVIPALNEASGIADTIRSIPVQAFRSLGLEVEVLVVDNGSEDATGAIASRAGARVVREPRRGYGHAYRRGFSEASGDVICTMDADGTYPASELPRLVETLASEDLDFISTDRFAYMHNGVMSRRNKWGNAALSGAARVLYGLPFRDSQSGMWVFRRSLLDRVRLRSSGMSLSRDQDRGRVAAEGPVQRGAHQVRLPQG